jgi:hypothetical protein
LSARELYQRWHKNPVRGIYELDINLNPSEPWVELGAACELVYESDKWDRRERVKYEHKFARGYPRLIAHPTQAALLIVGGKFQITDRGILK